MSNYISLSSDSIAVYENFKQKIGSAHIAKPTTLEVILRICKQEKTQTDFGNGRRYWDYQLHLAKIFRRFYRYL